MPHVWRDVDRRMIGIEFVDTHVLERVDLRRRVRLERLLTLVIDLYTMFCVSVLFFPILGTNRLQVGALLCKRVAHSLSVVGVSRSERQRTEAKDNRDERPV